MGAKQDLLYAQALLDIDAYHSWDATLPFHLTPGVNVSDTMPYILDLPLVEQDIFDIGSNLAYKYVLINC
jgi:hypothetical protein